MCWGGDRTCRPFPCSLAIEATGATFSAAELGTLLGSETRIDVDAFLKDHKVYDFTAGVFEQHRETLHQLLANES
jgi:hypothetical protein